MKRFITSGPRPRPEKNLTMQLVNSKGTDQTPHPGLTNTFVICLSFSIISLLASCKTSIF